MNLCPVHCSRGFLNSGITKSFWTCCSRLHRQRITVHLQSLVRAYMRTVKNWDSQDRCPIIDMMSSSHIAKDQYHSWTYDYQSLIPDICVRHEDRSLAKVVTQSPMVFAGGVELLQSGDGAWGCSREDFSIKDGLCTDISPVLQRTYVNVTTLFSSESKKSDLDPWRRLLSSSNLTMRAWV